MPTPWGACRPKFTEEETERRRIRDPRKRALTLRQLRELCEFVKRLCKTGLLRYPDTPYNQGLGRAGCKIKWTDITQHDINSEIIKKVIPREHSCSWSELVSFGRPKSRDFFCSHSWSEPLRDFMATIEHHARENCVGSEEAYWICVYANDQWAVDLGWKLQDSPFYEALRGAETTVLMMDRRFEVFQRMWVVFEMSETRRLKQDLQIWTPVGRVGSPQVASGPMVQAVDLLDTAAAQASNPCDQRQIMNYVAGVDEFAGLVQDPQGGKQLDPGADPRYEKRLVEGHRAAFEDLNMSIRETAQVNAPRRGSALGLSLGRQGSAVDPALRGITLVQLRTFAQNVSDTFRAGSFTCDDPDSPTFGQEVTWENANWHHVFRYFIRKELADSGREGCSYVQYLTFASQRPEYHVTCSWYATYRNFMAALEWHAEARQLPDSTVYWIDALALEERELVANGQTEGRRAQYEIPSRVIGDHAAGVVLYVDKGGHWAASGWVAYQIHMAFEFGKSFDILDRDGALAATRPFADTSWCFGHPRPDCSQQVLEFDVAKIKMKDESDRRMVLNSIAGAPESQGAPRETCLEYKQLNYLLNCKAAGPLLREYAFNGDTAAIDKVVETCPGMNLDEKGLQGVLGEKALHIAAAAGHVETVRYLLNKDSDPDAADLMGETPLHCAALAGQLGTVKQLLDFEADPLRKSYDGETPLHVALQNPAYFLGVETREVIAALEAAQVKVKRWGRRTADASHPPTERVRLCLAEQVRRDLAAKRREVAMLQARLAELLPGEAECEASETPTTAASVGEGSPLGQGSAASHIMEKLRSICIPGTRLVELRSLEDVLCNLGISQDVLQEVIAAFRQSAGIHGEGGTVDCPEFLEWLFGEEPA